MNFNEFQLLIFFFHDCAFGVVSKKSLSNPRSSRFSPMLSSRHFIELLCFTFRSVIHFELSFVTGIRSYFCIWMSTSLTLFGEKTTLFPVNCFWSFIKDELTILVSAWCLSSGSYNHTMCDLNNRHLFLTVLEAGRSKIKIISRSGVW